MIDKVKKYGKGLCAILFFIVFINSCEKHGNLDDSASENHLPQLNAYLKLTDGKYPPVITLDTSSISDDIARRAEFFYITSISGFDSMGEPDRFDTPLTAKGIIMDVQNSHDVLYIKVIGRCDGYQDTFLKAVVRNWSFDRNYIAPQTLKSFHEGLELSLEQKYQEKTDILDEMVTYPRVGYVGMNLGRAFIRPLLGGNGWMYASFFGGSFKDTVFSMYRGDRKLYSISMPGAEYYYENSIKKSVKTGSLSIEDVLNFSWSFKLWMIDMAFLEVQRYKNDQQQSVGADGLIEDLK